MGQVYQSPHHAEADVLLLRKQVITLSIYIESMDGIKKRVRRRRAHVKSSGDAEKSVATIKRAASPPTEKTSWRGNLRSSKTKGSVLINMNGNLEPARVMKSCLQNHIKAYSEDTKFSTQRTELLHFEQNVYWDSKARRGASDAERRAAHIVYKIREHERIDPGLYGNLPGEAMPEDHTLDMGGRFLVNRHRIKLSKVYAIAKEMPKGSHLHLHFNSELQPEALFPRARAMVENFYVRSTRPLIDAEDFERTEIVFNVLPKDKPTSNIFGASYDPDHKDPMNACWMRWSEFRSQFEEHFPKHIELENKADQLEDDSNQLDLPERWAREKMVITKGNAYNDRQTHNGVWACFNQGTRALKGLMNYEGIYRWYIGNAIDSMIRDKIMYAELRPMLLDKTIPSDDGLRQMDHKDQMNMVCEEVRKKQEELQARGELYKFPFGLKIIYCTPRSIPKAKMQSELEDCIKLKLQFPDLICGFDLVGAEDRPNCISFYADQLLAFTATCKDLGISIPFMFHAGETLLDTGGSSDPSKSNLYDALLLNAKRIGHGYALTKHPLLTKKYIEQNICLELCPISNELLHLCGNARENPYPALLASGLHCTLNSDNPSLFRSSLSHEFYQVMVGDPRFNLHGWRQLVEWSVEHSCISEAEQKEAYKILGQEWEAFCGWVIREYGDYAEGLPDLP